MNGIDISSVQAGLDLSKIPFDFAIVKATQGTNYTNPYCVGHVDQAASLGKLVGVYHYIGGGNAKGEAQFFVDSIRNWVGKHVIAVDWEQYQNSAWGDQSYLETVVSEVIRLTGVHPLIYGQQSVYNTIAAVGRKYDCGLWVAQYADMNPTGYQDSPWNEGAYACAVRQYSSVGRLPGYGSNLNLDKFYGNADQWNAYAHNAGGNTPPPAPAPPAPPVNNANTGTTYVVQRGDTLWGIAQKYGTTYQHLADINGIREPDKINAGQVIHIDTAPLPDNRTNATYVVQPGDNLTVIAKKFGTTVNDLAAINGISHDRLDYIQAGQTLKVPGQQSRTYVVKPGDTLSQIAARFGMDYHHLADINNIKDPDKIQSGWILHY